MPCPETGMYGGFTPLSISVKLMHVHCSNVGYIWEVNGEARVSAYYVHIYSTYSTAITSLLIVRLLCSWLVQRCSLTRYLMDTFCTIAFDLKILLSLKSFRKLPVSTLIGFWKPVKISWLHFEKTPAAFGYALFWY